MYMRIFIYTILKNPILNCCFKPGFFCCLNYTKGSDFVKLTCPDSSIDSIKKALILLGLTHPIV